MYSQPDIIPFLLADTKAEVFMPSRSMTSQSTLSSMKKSISQSEPTKKSNRMARVMKPTSGKAYSAVIHLTFKTTPDIGTTITSIFTD